MTAPDQYKEKNIPGRNDPCPCGSGKKFKKCCGANVRPQTAKIGVIDIEAAVTAFEAGDFESARDLCLPLLDEQPDNADIQHVYALSSYQLGDMAAAETAFKKALSFQPKNSWINSNYSLLLKDLGRYSEAEIYGKRAVELDKKNPDALNNLGTLYRTMNRIQEAIDCFKRSLKLDASSPSILINLGEACMKLEKLNEAEEIFLKVLSINSENAAAKNNLGVVYQRKREYTKALSLLDEVIQSNPSEFEALNNIGLVYRDMLDSTTAERYFRQALMVNPGYVQPLKNLADIYLDRRNLEVAIDFCKRAISVNTVNPVGYQKLASIYKEQYRPQLAIETIDTAIRLVPNDYELYLSRAELYEHFGKLEDARADYSKAVELSGGIAPVYLNWAHFEERANNLAESQRILEKIVSNGPGLQIELNLLKATILRRLGDLESALKLIEGIPCDDEQRSKIATSVFKEKADILDKQRKYSDAFKYYVLAAKSRGVTKNAKFNPEEYKNSVDKEIALFKKEMLESLLQLAPRSTADNPIPIFIVGFPRSGTTLLEQILCSHPKIEAGDELPFVNELVDKIPDDLGSNKPYPECIVDLPVHSESRKLVMGWRQYYQARADELGLRNRDAIFYTDKMPLNLQYLPLISMIFPESPIIHIMRNPMDAVLSSVFSSFAYGMSWANDLSHAASYCKENLKLVNHFVENMPWINYQLIKYEDLVDQQETWTRKIIEFVGAEWDARCLEFHKTKRVARTASYEQVTKKIYTSSVARYRNYEEHLSEPLEILKPVMEKYGYL